MKFVYASLTPDGAPRPDAPPPAASDRETIVVLGPEGAYAHPEIERILRAAAAERPDVEIFYADEAEARGEEVLRLLKPAFDADLLASSNYPGLLLAIRGSALRRLGGLDPAMGPASLYDFLLRAGGEGVVVDAVRAILLFHPHGRPTPRAGALEKALTAHAARSVPAATVLPGLTPGSLRLRRHFNPFPDTTLIVPTRRAAPDGGRPFLHGLLHSLAKSTWPMDRLQVLIGDDVGGEAGLDLAGLPMRVRRIATPRPADAPFNYAAKMNHLWRASESEQLVLMNDDVEVLAPDWLEALATFSTSADVGGAGARLLYADGSLQHAGMIGGLLGVFAHAWIGQDPEAPTYQDWSRVQRGWSAVTGAVFATRREALETVNGFDERFALEYNDVDLCLRMKAAGLRIAYAPDAVLRHHEKRSRGSSAPPGSQTAAFLRRWGDLILDDPAYHPDLTRDSLRVEPSPQPGTWPDRTASLGPGRRF